MMDYATKGHLKERCDFFWKLTKERIAAATEPIMQNMRKVTVLAATGAALGACALLLAARLFMRRHQF